MARIHIREATLISVSQRITSMPTNSKPRSRDVATIA